MKMELQWISHVNGFPMKKLQSPRTCVRNSRALTLTQTKILALKFMAACVPLC